VFGKYEEGRSIAHLVLIWAETSEGRIFVICLTVWQQLYIFQEFRAEKMLVPLLLNTMKVDKNESISPQCELM